jgi:hypothetical protein
MVSINSKRLTSKLVILVLFTIIAHLHSSCQLQSPTIAQVGSYSITQQDVDLQEQILRLSYPQYQGDLKQAALKQLTDSFTFAEVLKNNGQPITPETLKKESDRIDKTTLMPEAENRKNKAHILLNPMIFGEAFSFY